MEYFNPNFLLIVGGILAVTIEILLGAPTGFDLLLIGIIVMVSGTAGMMFNSFSTAVIFITFLSFVYLFIGRKMIKNKLSIKTSLTNTEKLIGKKALVVKTIEKHLPGQVKIDGEIWRAEADKKIEKGIEVLVQSVSGVTLHVV